MQGFEDIGVAESRSYAHVDRIGGDGEPRCRKQRIRCQP
jgi:hypothetical protein